jgi:4-amino-4-deoxy-L-arabinose transferase-like glycosyltransferase
VIARVGSAQAALPRSFTEAVTARKILQAVLVGGACLYVVAFIGSAVARLFFPFPLEITEGASLEVVRAILRGHALYEQPTVEHVPMIYGPTYFYAVALVSLAVGPSFATLRLVSLVASVGSIALVYLLVKRATTSTTVGLLAGGLFAASYPLSDGALDLGRVDALLLCLLLASLYATRLSGLRSAAVAGAAMGLAILTKQSAAPIAAALLAYYLLSDRRRVIAFTVGLAVTVAVPFALLELQSGHWTTLFLLELPRQHELSELRAGRFWNVNVLPRFTLALLMGVLFVLVRMRQGHRSTALFYVLATASTLGVSWASDSNAGAAANVLLPAYAMLAILFGRSDAWADERLSATLSSLPGTVFAPDFDAFVQAAGGRPEQPYSGSAAELMGSYGGHTVAEGEAWRHAVSAQLRQRVYDYVVLDPESWLFFLNNVVEQSGYVDAGPLFPTGDEFWLWRTGRTPKAEVFVPQERLATLRTP